MTSHRSASPRPPSLLWEELKRAYVELRGDNASPARGAAAVALGLFIGCIPIFGLHAPLVLGLCLLLRLDGFVAYVAANISNPLFSAVLMTVEVQVGAWLMTGAPLPLHDVEAAKAAGFAGLVKFLFVGAPVVGAVLAVVGAASIYFGTVIKRRFRPPRPRAPYRLPDHAPPWWHAVERVASRYSPIGADAGPAERSRFHYVRMKLLGDPVMKRIADEEALGEVLDVGTGRGQLPITLLELGRAEAVTGFDWDAAKIDAARAAAEVPPALRARFEVADMADASTDYPAADTVLLVDVLHYLDAEVQDEVLERAARAVRPGGRLLLREADTERGWRSAVTLLEERLFTALRFNRGARVQFRAARDRMTQLEAAGLRCRVEPAWGKTPFSNVLIIAERPDA